MKKIFFKKSWLWAIVLCMLAVFAPTRQVEAAEAGIVSFELYEDGEDTCSKYDVTGDKIQDTVKVTGSAKSISDSPLFTDFPLTVTVAPLLYVNVGVNLKS